MRILTARTGALLGALLLAGNASAQMSAPESAPPPPPPKPKPAPPPAPGPAPAPAPATAPATVTPAPAKAGPATARPPAAPSATPPAPAAPVPVAPAPRKGPVVPVPQVDDYEVPPQIGTMPPLDEAVRRRRAPREEEDEPPRVRTYRPPAPRSGAQPATSMPGVRGTPQRDPTEDLLVRSQAGVTFATMLDELLDDVVHQIAAENPRLISPLAIRYVRVSPNLRPSLSQSIEARLTARLAKLPNLAQVVCVECRAVRSRVEGDDWVVTLGAVHQSDLRRVADEIGAKAFLDLDLTLQQVPTELVVAARIFRADDGRVLWASAVKGDETTAAVLRTGKIPPSREEQLAELKRKLDARPWFGYLAFIGFMYIPATGPGYFGANPGIRIFERFGAERRHVFGMQGEGMINWAPNRPLFGGILSIGYWYSLFEPNLNKPDLRLGVTMGGFIVGTQGNTVVTQLSAEYVLQFRLAISVSALYALPAKYPENTMEELGGIGAAARAAFQW